jgi:HEAT repeat protein
MVSIKNKYLGEEIENYIAELGSEDGLKRQSARHILVHYGSDAVPGLANALANDNEHVRWEAAKALGEIEHPDAAPVLVKALEDENISVRWAAMESLIRLKRAAIEPLLKGLTRDFNSVWLREGAHHVLHQLKNQGLLDGPEIKVFNALEGAAPVVEVPWAAEAALEAARSSG